jgi:hypothetical protein
MPRRPTSGDAVGAARFFLEGFIERTDSQDHILPKNDTFSPFCGFCRVFPEVPCPSPLLRSAVLSSPRRLLTVVRQRQFSKKKDGGSATDGVSRAAFNKICLEYFEEGMRKPARNGNPGSLESGLAQQRRHFLRGRWRDPQTPTDMAVLKNMWTTMTPEQVAASRALLEDFSRWKPGPAGRGGERLSRKRGSEEEGASENEFDSGDNHSPYPPGAAWDSAPAPMPSKMEVFAPIAPQVPVGPPLRKRINTREVHGKRDMHHAVRMDGPGPLELLCNVAFNSDQMVPHHMSPEHGQGILEPHSLGHDADLAAERLVKGSLGSGWHPHDLDSGAELGASNLSLREDDLALQDDEAHVRRHSHHYPPLPHSHLHAHPMHRMSASVGIDYAHAHPAHLHHAMGPYGGHHMSEGHRLVEGLRDLRGEVLPRHSLRAHPAPHLEGAWDSPSAQYSGPARVGGLPPTHPGPMHHSPHHAPMSHKSPRHAPTPHHGHRAASPRHVSMPHPAHIHPSPRHGPMAHKSPRHMPMSHAGKSPRHTPMGGHMGEMLPPSATASWIKSPGLSHTKPKKIPGRYRLPRTLSRVLSCKLQVSRERL